VSIGEAPELPLIAMNAVEVAHLEVSQDPTVSDDVMTYVANIDFSVPALEVFPAHYHWTVAMANCEEMQQATLGPLGVVAMLYNRAGEALWQRRTHRIAEQGMLWTPAAQGPARPGLAVSKSMVDIIGLELGLRADEVELCPRGLVIYGGDRGLRVVYEGIISNDAILRPDSSLVSDLLWAEQTAPPSQMSHDSDLLVEHLLDRPHAEPQT